MDLKSLYTVEKIFNMLSEVYYCVFYSNQIDSLNHIWLYLVSSDSYIPLKFSNNSNGTNKLKLTVSIYVLLYMYIVYI